MEDKLNQLYVQLTTKAGHAGSIDANQAYTDAARMVGALIQARDKNAAQKTPEKVVVDGQTGPAVVEKPVQAKKETPKSPKKTAKAAPKTTKQTTKTTKKAVKSGKKAAKKSS